MTAPQTAGQLAAFDAAAAADQLALDDVEQTHPAQADAPNPDRLIDERPATLLDTHRDHRIAIAEHLTGRRRVDEPDLAAHALGSLAAAEALVDRLLAQRWETAAVALRAGARIRDVARACGLTDGDVQAGTRRYAGRLPVERADVLLALVADGVEA